MAYFLAQAESLRNYFFHPLSIELIGLTALLVIAGVRS